MIDYVDSHHYRVEGSDISLCVLSLPDVCKKTSDGYAAHIPPTLKPLLKPDTCFLLNKSDLSVEVSEEEIRRVLGGPVWITSLSTGAGTSGFLKGFSSVLKDRYVLQAPKL
jgi:tRNA modification GTPase